MDLRGSRRGEPRGEGRNVFVRRVEDVKEEGEGTVDLEC